MSIVKKILRESEINEISTKDWEGRFHFENDDDLRDKYLSLRVNRFKTEKWGTYEVFIEDWPAGLDLHICKDRMFIGTLELRKVDLLGVSGYEVGSVEIVEWHRGKGVAPSLYSFALTKVTPFLLSDLAQSSSAQAIWKNIAQGFYMYAYEKDNLYRLDDSLCLPDGSSFYEDGFCSHNCRLVAANSSNVFEGVAKDF